MLKLNPFSTDTTLRDILAKENSPAPSEKIASETGITLENVTKVYPMGRRNYQALGGVSLSIEPGEFVAIVGPSGSGKSTILNIMTGIDKPTSGKIAIGGRDIGKLSENELARWRGENVGIVFQFFQLLPTLTALENVMLPLHLRGTKANYQGDDRRKRALANLHMVELFDHAQHLPRELSGGEQQRVAIARALANDPPIVVADEPTGNLDSVTGDLIFKIFRQLADEGKTVIYVTHDNHLARQARRLIQVRDGAILSDEPAINR
jgi:putative ABC transport system ATP-binding protein